MRSRGPAPLLYRAVAPGIFFGKRPGAAVRSFVLVQYKALEKGEQGDAEFRWTGGDQFSDEISRMDALLDELSKVAPDDDPDGFRFNSNPFFLKFCTRIVFNPDDKAMFPGMYLPHGLWRALAAGNRLKGTKGGNVLTFRNVGRRLNNSEFVTLVGGAWVGTTLPQSALLERLIRSVLETGRTVTFAVRRTPKRDSRRSRWIFLPSPRTMSRPFRLKNFWRVLKNKWLANAEQRPLRLPGSQVILTFIGEARISGVGSR